VLNAEGVRAKSAQGGAKSAVRACQGPGRRNRKSQKVSLSGERRGGR